MKTSSEFIQSYFEKSVQVLDLLPKQKIEAVITLLMRTWEQGGIIYTMGNGGSASTASHFAADLAKYTVVEGKKRFKVIGLTDNVPLVSAWTNDGGFGTIFSEQMRPWLGPNDTLVGFSVHGGSGLGDAGPWSQNLTKAIKLAKEKGAKVVSFSGFDGGAMKELSDICIVIPLDSEPMATPVIESFHVFLHHLIVAALRECIQKIG